MGNRWRIGTVWTSLNQDNRQPGREDADFLSSSVALSAALSAARSLDLAIDLAHEQVENVEIQEIEDTWRLTGGARWRIGAGHEIDLQAGWSESEVSRLFRRQENVTGDATWSWKPRLGAVFGRPLAGRIFLRYSNRQSLSVDPIFGIFDDRSAWTVTTGLNLSWGM
jgi:hypothetical protein